MRYRKIPDETVRRLPVYLRGALHLSRANVEKTSSKELADLTGIESWQIRKDFSYFGDFGTRGVGYDLRSLISRINKILRLSAGHKAALVGVGNLGSALLAFPGFRMFGLEIAAAFDVDRRKVGRRKAGVLIEDVASLRDLNRRGIHLGIIAVPEAASQDVAEALVDAGVKGILNFAPRYIVVSPGVKLITIDIAMHLARLPYYVPAG
ncbi:MAG: redox-sensing transcriptional repressor Rex [Planctomycetes bacterium RBG_13_60_9]|nr:MAG: redox-sensing transcriptional repressor Rex [Planctomycetes bacterium RBG_13_60_9]